MDAFPSQSGFSLPKKTQQIMGKIMFPLHISEPGIKNVSSAKEMPCQF